jgi:ABC-type transport system substrate-binding protein
MHPVGTGPFQLVERTPGERIVLKAFKGYWRGAPAIAEIDMPIIPEDATRSMMLQAGDLDVALRVPPDDIARLKQDKNIDILVKPSVLNMYVGINTIKYPFNDKTVRQALNYAVDKKLISNTILTNVSTPADSPLSPATWGYYATGLYPYDPGKAKDLLARAGWKPGAGGILEKDGKPFKAQLWTPIGRYLKDTSVTEAIASQIRAVGIDVDVRTFEWGAFLASVDKPRDAGQQELFLLAWGPSTADADWVLRPLFESSMVKPKGSNRFYFSNAEVDKLIAEQMNTVDPKKRYEICKEGQIKVMEEAPIIPIAELHQVIGVRSNVQGIIVLATDHVLATKARFKK